MEKKGRGGKTVTVVDGLPDNATFLKDLSQELKRLCGTGGAAVEGGVELQGDLRDRVREYPGEEGLDGKGLVQACAGAVAWRRRPAHRRRRSRYR